MDKKTKAKWLKALRSGKYKQIDASLRVYDFTSHSYSYCCLGVLREVANGGASKSSLGEYLGTKFCQRIGLEPKRDVPSDGIQDTLCKMNDRGIAFSEIADYIEENL